MATRRVDPNADICPFSNLACRRAYCSIWDDYWRCCSLHRDSLAGTTRTALCDAAVEVIKAYKLADRRPT